MLSVSDLRKGAHQKLLAIQKIARFISTEDFKDCYEASSLEEKSIIIKIIDDLDYDQLKKKVREYHYKNLTTTPVMDLRRLAQKLRIKNYNTLYKTHLIEAIENAKREAEDIPRRDEEISPQIGA